MVAGGDEDDQDDTTVEQKEVKEGENVAAYGGALQMCCVNCACASLLPRRRICIMSRLRALTWLRSAGLCNQTTCLVCKLPNVPVYVLGYGDVWQLAHLTAKARGGSRVAENMFPAHATCNIEQGVRSVNELYGDADALPIQAMSTAEAREALAHMTR